MASFVEQATLKVNDQSSAAIRKINAELKKLERTAKSLKSISVNLKINTAGLQAANKHLNSLANNMSRMRGQPLNLRVNTAGLTQAQNQINRLRQAAARPITVNTRGTGGGGGGGPGGGPGRRGLRQTGIQHQMGNFSVGRGAASVVIGGTAYAVAANVTKGMVAGVMDSEDARMRLRQSGFDKYYPGTETRRTDDKTPQVDYLMEAARRNQETFTRIPAALVANAAVEQLNAIKASTDPKEWPQGKPAAMEAAMKRIAANAQTMGMTYKDFNKGAENARQLERMTQIMGKDIDDTDIRKFQEAAMRSVIASGGEITIEEAVRSLQQLGSSIAKSLSPQALGDLLSIRDEGGRASTAEWRMTVQDLMRDSLDPDDKAAMAKAGLRKVSGDMEPTIVKEAGSDLFAMVDKRIVPLLKKAGVYDKTSAEIAAHLDKFVGFSTSGARGIADIVTAIRTGEAARMRAAREFVDLDPRLGDRTFRGGTDRLSASLQTAMGRALDKSGGAFADAVQPFSVAMDKAGKAAEGGQYGEAALEMTKGVAQMMGGPAGAIITAMSAVSAARTLMDPTASPIEKGAAMLVTGSSALLTAAGAMTRYFGGGDPKEDLAHQQQLEKTIPAEIENYKKQIAAEEGKAKPNRQRLADLNRALTAAETMQRDVQRNIITSQARVDAANAEAAAIKAEDDARMAQLRRDAGLDAVTGQPVTAPAAAGPIPAETVKALQELGAAGGLAGVKSIVNLLKTLNQPTSIKAREELATQLGYTGPLGGSAAMNTFLLNFFKKLATAVPEPPPAVTPPPPPEPPEVRAARELPKVTPSVTVTPGDEPIPVTVTEPPAEPPEVKAARELPKVTPSVTVTPADGPVVTPVVPAPRPLTEFITPVPLSSLITPAAYTPNGATTPPPAVTPPAPQPISNFIDPGSVPSLFAATFTAGAAYIGASGTVVGTNAASALSGQAGSIGAAIGNAAASRISAATVNVNIPNTVTAKAPTGEIRAT